MVVDEELVALVECYLDVVVARHSFANPLELQSLGIPAVETSGYGPFVGVLLEQLKLHLVGMGVPCYQILTALVYIDIQAVVHNIELRAVATYHSALVSVYDIILAECVAAKYIPRSIHAQAEAHAPV